MTLNYDAVWKKMNELEMVTSKICSARQILDSAISSLESGNREKTETLMYAVDEFLQYYLEDFDRKFKDAWNETVVKIKNPLICSNNDPSIECNNSWNNFWEENSYSKEYKEDKVIKWQLPVEMDGPSGEYFVSFPDDLLEAAGLEEGDDVSWVDNGDGTFTLKKITGTLRMDEC